MKKEDLLFLRQLVESLTEAGEDLEKAYQKRDYQDFNSTKRIMFKIQREIADLTKND